jgi:hypothetical protein
VSPRSDYECGNSLHRYITGDLIAYEDNAMTKWPPPDELIPASDYDDANRRARMLGSVILLCVGFIAGFLLGVAL